MTGRGHVRRCPAPRTWSRSPTTRTGRVALPAAHRGVVRAHRARPRRDGRLLGGPQPRRAAHPLRHAATEDAAPDWRDPAVTDDRASGAAAGCSPGGSPRRPTRSATWSATSYARDRGDERAHALGPADSQSRIEYADYGDRADPSFLVRVDFDYEQRPDPFSDYRAGFEIRTTLRCRAIRVSTHAADGVARAVREYRFGYEQAPFNGVSPAHRASTWSGSTTRPAAAAVRTAAAADVRLLRRSSRSGAGSAR